MAYGRNLIRVGEDGAGAEAGSALARADREWITRGRFQRLSEAVRELASARTHDEVVEIVRRSARRLSGAMGVAVVLKDEGFCHYLVEDSEAPLWSGQRFPLEACISGWAMLHNEQVVIPDIYVDDRIPHDAYRPTGIHSLVMTPVGEPAFAALGAYWYEVRNPEPDEIAVMAALAGCMATALENIQLVGSLQAEAARAEEGLRHQRLLINELNHRVKNTLAIVQSIAAQSLRGDRPTPAARDDFEARLMALARAHMLMTEGGWRTVEASDLICRTLEPFLMGEDAQRFTIEGPSLPLGPRASVAFALAFHELATNAAKYGALSKPGGRVSVRWSVEGGRLALAWRESGGPPVVPPKAKGFGSRLIERGMASELRGAVTLSYPPEGLVCAIDAPSPALQAPEEIFPLPV